MISLAKLKWSSIFTEQLKQYVLEHIKLLQGDVATTKKKSVLSGVLSLEQPPRIPGPTCARSKIAKTQYPRLLPNSEMLVSVFKLVRSDRFMFLSIQED